MCSTMKKCLSRPHQDPKHAMDDLHRSHLQQPIYAGIQQCCSATVIVS